MSAEASDTILICLEGYSTFKHLETVGTNPERRQHRLRITVLTVYWPFFWLAKYQ
jgi:hypothetical protein